MCISVNFHDRRYQFITYTRSMQNLMDPNQRERVRQFILTPEMVESKIIRMKDKKSLRVDGILYING